MGPAITQFDEETTGQSWYSRSALWHQQNIQPVHKPSLFRRPTRVPLILAGHGVSLRIDHGALFVKGGRTHHPQKVEEYRFFPGAKNLPSRIVILDGSGSLTFEVIDWLMVQAIPLIRIDWRGEVVTVIGKGCVVSP